MPPSARNSRTKPRKGAIPVPAPIMMMGVVDFRGSRKVDGRAEIHNLWPFVVRQQSIEEQTPRKLRGAAAASAPKRSKQVSAAGAAKPRLASSGRISARERSSSATTLTQMPILCLSSREDEAIVYGRFFCRGHSCKNVPKSTSAEAKKSSKSSLKLNRTPSPVNHWYVCLSSMSPSKTARSPSSRMKVANFFSAALLGAAQRSQ
mmetsp:Transcript_73301/g.184693  ORF Transcript_73301/g.184693 Transcript_73301/m.184693 type:complete len:205 (+) Transcript_73301:591-1205(+)